MATARKLPSGNYRVRIYQYTDQSGKKHYKSFTSKTKKKAERKASIWQTSISQSAGRMTMAEAAEAYIDERRPVLSPSTIRGYVTACKQIEPIEAVQVNEITQGQIQSFISSFSKTHAPKTTHNVHGFISAIMRRFRPDFSLSTKLPQKSPDTIYIPSESDIQRLLKGAEDDPIMYRALLLAAYGPLRRSEICAVTSNDLEGNVLHVHSAIVEDEKGQWHEKLTKTNAGDRYISLPQSVTEAMQGINGKLVDILPNALQRRFLRLLRDTGVTHMRFHSLRHFCASQLHALGMPDAYIMQRGGWESDGVLKSIYRHALTDYAASENDRINAAFDAMIKYV